jgi:hypothetical protein
LAITSPRSAANRGSLYPDVGTPAGGTDLYSSGRGALAVAFRIGFARGDTPPDVGASRSVHVSAGDLRCEDWGESVPGMAA